jgi:hypothetical protein
VSYRYEEHREWLASDEGIKAVGQVIRNVEQRLDYAGAAMMCKLWPAAGDSWEMMAAVDRVVALGMIVEVEQAQPPAGQHRVFRRRLE